MSIYLTIETKKHGSIEFPKEMDPNDEGFVYGNNIPDVMDKLDHLAKKCEVQPLATFIMDEYFLNDLVSDTDEEEIEDAELMWFSPSEGLVCVNALIKSLTNANPSFITSIFGQSFPLEDIRWILWDLEAYRMILEEAQRSNDQFRIVVC